MTPIRVVELFAGIGAQASALERAGIPHEVAAVCEIDRFAYASYCAIHGDVPNLGDITKLERLPDDIDLLTYSFPCQDLSLAGKHRGMAKDSGTRSGLLWEVERLLLEARSRDELPKVLQMENVDAIVNRKNKRQFDSWIRSLSEMGYSSSWKILNAKDFNIPQNRARCFMISCLDGKTFEFPQALPKVKRLADCLEAEVDERYFLSEDRVVKLIAHKERNRTAGNGFGFSITDVNGDARACTTRQREEHDTLIRVAQIIGSGFTETTGRVYDPEGNCPTINTCGGGGLQPKIAIRNCTAQGYVEAEEREDGLILDQPDSKTKRGRVQKGMSPTVMTSGQVGVVQGMRIRRLTPRECWRVMDFTDEDFDKAKAAGISDSQLYKQAGNSICVGVLQAIYLKLYTKKKRTALKNIFSFDQGEMVRE